MFGKFFLFVLSGLSFVARDGMRIDIQKQQHSGQALILNLYGQFSNSVKRGEQKYFRKVCELLSFLAHDGMRIDIQSRSTVVKH